MTPIIAIIGIPFAVILIAGVAVRLVVRPRVTPETDQERRDWQAW